MATLLMTLPFASAQAASDHLDLTGVTHIRILGQPGSVVLTTGPAEAYSGAISHKRSGWIGQLSSIWSYGECTTKSTLKVESDTLTVDIASSELSNCHATFTANVKEGSSVTIEQPAAEIDLKGVFRQVRLVSSAADFNFSGEVRDLDLNSNALKANIAYTSVHKDETIMIDSKFMDADMRFADTDAISYRIDADASMVNSRFPNTQGVKPEVLIKAEKAKVSIN
ncbi:hypothetical protein [Martelella soudanensis]|uniref:hypothetical protein n=1 Tax=Martelella sp. NC20 TaxID=2740298 RepID=UPI0015DD55D2|nr:hypothetical protein [Martelella sp. NC20]